MFSSPRAALVQEIQGVRKQLQEKRLFLSKRKSLVLSRNIRSKSTPHVMKRSAATGEHQRRPLSRVERRVRTLQRLVPSAKSMDLDGLFQETADYILNLEMKVKVMQILLKKY
ncbi:transcription factor UPBEAT1-like [Aristolochia californica]|uniref:transcription factor UPBEAT1-like n=1 Tax=Aristolochia californica TaxID=171875 RepID=UPI0035D867A1